MSISPTGQKYNGGIHHINGSETDSEKRAVPDLPPSAEKPRSLGAATALPCGAIATTLTTLSLSLMEWRGVTVENVYVANLFFVSSFGLVITAQWELSIGNGFAYTVFSAFGFFYAGFGAILTPAFGIAQAYDDPAELNNALGFFFIIWTIFVLTFVIASLPTNLCYIAILSLVDICFLLVAASYFSAADGNMGTSVALKKASGVFCFLGGFVGWYLTMHVFCAESMVVLPLGDTSHYFKKPPKIGA
jgi:hypothetical protein